MTFERAKSSCHVRSAIYRESKPNIKYWYNHTESLEKRIPIKDQIATDWKEYDPADDYPPYYRMA